MPTSFHWIKTIATAKPALWLGIVLSAAIGLVFYVATANTIERNSNERFKNLARTVQYTINVRVKTFTDVLRGTASLFQAASGLSRHQFHAYVEGLSLDQNFPGIETINFARYFTQAERPAVERAMREDLGTMASGYPVFNIDPPGQRSTYTALTYIEPITAWSMRFGLDLYARPPVAKAFDEARDSGMVQTSGYPVKLGPNVTGLGMRLPVYRSDMPKSTVQERRAAYVGSVGIGFSVERMVQKVLDGLPLRGMRLTVTGIGPVPGASATVQRRAVLFDNAGTKSNMTPGADVTSNAMFRTVLPIDFNGRTWEADFSMRKAELYSGFDAYVPWLAMLAGFVSTMLLYALFHTLSSSRRHAVDLAQEMTRELRASEAKLQLSNETLRRLAAHTEKIKEGERKRIAREIHDDLGQNLLALRIEADMLASRTGEHHPRLHARASSTLQQIDSTIRSVRQIINDLRPNVLDLGLNAAVDWQIEQFRRRTGIECELVENDHEIQVADHGATALFRILQESLTNISRHAHATQVRVELRIEKDWISMTIGDNGIGLNTGGRHKPGSFGLVGIEERVNILGGTFVINSGPGRGTTVGVSIPLHEQPTSPEPAASAPSSDGRLSALA
jgi:signal transduction histidine kinase